MSQNINNREEKQQQLMEVIKELHAGKTVEEVKDKFAAVIDGVSPKEIGEMEVALVKDGLPIEEIQYLCDVHAEVFKGTLEEIHHPEQIPGHPVYTMKEENEAIRELIEGRIEKDGEDFAQDDSKENVEKLLAGFKELMEIEKHYSRKENLIFPYLEKHGVTAPPKVMWGVHDEIRAKLKAIIANLEDYQGQKDQILEDMKDALHQTIEMIFKEENILFPMSLETLLEEEWITVYKESDEIGYSFVKAKDEWGKRRIGEVEEEEELEEVEGEVSFPYGSLTTEELNAIMETIPSELSFVDKENRVRFFTKGEHRIFARTKSVIGREVEHCHPHTSVHKVNQIIEDFRSGARDSEIFWIQLAGKFVLIRFYAIRNPEGEYLGTLEYVEDISAARELTGEKRLLSEI